VKKKSEEVRIEVDGGKRMKSWNFRYVVERRRPEKRVEVERRKLGELQIEQR
jgi:hypothetical protein